jgi:Membrane bound beta barrel domain (DUF5777)
MLRKILGLALFVSCLSAGTALGQAFAESRLINLPTQYPVGYGTIELWFTHRFTETIHNAGGYDLFGFDSAADVGIGLALGLAPNLDVELYRSSFFKELESAAKFTAVRQGDGSPLGLAFRVGVDHRGARGVDQRWSGFVQMIAGHRFGTAIEVFVMPMYASDTPTLKRAVNVGVGVAGHFGRGWDVTREVIPRNRDAAGGELAWAVGLVKRVHGHEFLVYLGDSRATTVDLLTGSDLPGGFSTGDVRLGFNLVRRFPA